MLHGVIREFAAEPIDRLGRVIYPVGLGQGTGTHGQVSRQVHIETVKPVQGGDHLGQPALLEAGGEDLGNVGELHHEDVRPACSAAAAANAFPVENRPLPVASADCRCKAR